MRAGTTFSPRPPSSDRRLIAAEKHNLSRYDDVLRSAEAPADVREILLKNRQRLEEAITRMRSQKV